MIVILWIVGAVQVLQAEEGFEPGRMLGSDYDLEEAFDPEELLRLASLEDRNRSQNRRLMMLILRAGLEADPRFKALVVDEELRTNNSADLALSAYDYALHQNDAALDHILAYLATEPVGADTNTIIILSTLNEWDRSVKAFRKHFYIADGAGAFCYHGFKNVRRYLYPDEFANHEKAIEASS